MVFSSLSFLVFLPVIWLVFQFAPDRLRWLVLLLASLIFYAALQAPILLVTLTVVTFVTYLCGRWFHQQKDPRRDKRVLWIGVSANLLILASLKYLQIFNSIFKGLLHVDIVWSVPLVTIGVSYYTFQAISYLVDIYLGITDPELHFGRFALYMSFFPKLLQGPIERAGDLLPQLRSSYEFNYHNMRSGMLLFTWGLFEKLVIADRLSLFVNPVFGDVHSYSGSSLLIATYFYAFQIFADFSGYTDMALGAARMFNIRLTQNFNAPYLATSVADFWRRWHISFSRWILDYIFRPLQMHWREWGNVGTAVALLITFLASGLWHGASGGFICWGLLHGLYLAGSVFYRPRQKRIHKLLGPAKSKLLKAWQILVTFNLLSLAWIFFRANSLSDAIYICTHLFSGWSQMKLSPWSHAHSYGTMRGHLARCALIIFLLGIDYIKQRADVRVMVWTLPRPMRWIIYYALIFGILLLGKLGQNRFIYFQF